MKFWDKSERRSIGQFHFVNLLPPVVRDMEAYYLWTQWNDVDSLHTYSERD